MGPIERAERVVRLLLALRHPKVAEALAARGFDDANIDEGWALLRATTLRRMPQPSGRPDPALVQRRLSAWYREWGTLTATTLRRHYPEAAAHLKGLLALAPPPQRGGVLIVWLGAVTSPVSQGGRGKEGRAILALLEKRGLTPELLAEVSGLARFFEKDLPSGGPTKAEDFTAADEALWAYYTEWSQAIRTVLKDRRLLRGLGFLQSSRGGGGAEQEDEAADT